MMGKDHLWYGLSAGGTCALLALTGHLRFLPHPGPIDALWLVTASGVASLVPDFDEPGSLISNAPRNLGLLARRMIYRLGVGPLRPLAWVAGMIVLATSAALNGVSRFFSSIFRILALGHREGSHWLPVWAAASVGVYLLTVARLGLWPGAGFALGFLTHLIADGLTKAGLPLVPSTRRRLHLLPRHLRIRTGSRVESVVTVIYTLILGAVLGAVLVR